MKERTFNTHIFHSSPFAFSAMEFWDPSYDNAKDVILTNSLAREYGIAKMKLTLAKVSAFDADGTEHSLDDFPSYVELHPKGMGTEFHVCLPTSLSLPKGTYSAFRFYLTGESNRFVFTDRREEEVQSPEPLDFQIKNGLEVSGDTDRVVRLRFDFAPFTFGSYFRPLLEAFGKSKSTPRRLAHSFGS